jgi:hypothetical protein
VGAAKMPPSLSAAAGLPSMPPSLSAATAGLPGMPKLPFPGAGASAGAGSGNSPIPPLPPQAGAAVLVLKFLWNAVRFLIVMFVTIPLAGIFLIIYFAFYSIYGMLFYNDMNASNVAKIFKDMMEYIDNEDKEEDDGKEKTFTAKVIIKAKELIYFLYNNFYTFNYLFVFLAFLGIFYFTITNTNLKTALMYIDGTFVFTTLIFLLYILKKGAKSNTDDKDYDTSKDNFYAISYVVYPIISLITGGYILYKTFKMLQNDKSVKKRFDKIKDDLKELAPK